MACAITATSAAERANIAAAMIRRASTTRWQYPNSRAFDNCFEMGDGTQVVAYLLAKAVTDPRIADFCRHAKWGVWSNGVGYDPETDKRITLTETPDNA